MVKWNVAPVRYNVPCTPDCTERSATCHGVCEKYLSFERKNSERREREAMRSTNLLIKYVEKREV